MHFLVFIPDAKPADLDAVAKVAGLTSLIDGGQNVIPVQDGPADKSGLMLGWTSPHSPLTNYDPTAQDWIPSICKDENGTSRYHVGIWREDLTARPPRKPPTESELRRSYTQAGSRVQFGAEKWKLPTPDSVDARAVYADDGSMRWETIRQYSWVCDEAATLRETYLEEFGVRDMVFRVDPTVQIDWLVKLLQINYRMLPEVAVALEMWVGRDHIMATFLATLGLTQKGKDDA